MERNTDKEFKLEIDPSVNEVFDELPGQSFLAFRRLRWTESSPFRYDIRKWFTTSDGEEKAGKGVSFMTEEGPDNLISALMRHGFGDTRKTLEAIKDRPDFLPNVKEIIQREGYDLDSVTIASEDNDLQEFYDPKVIL